MKGISRRIFLKGAIAGTASAAAASVLGAPLLSAKGETIYTPGTYVAQAQGMGPVTVTMTFSETRITDVILDVSHETPEIGQAAAKQLKDALLQAQGALVDTVSGATITSEAVTKAAEKCIAQAKGEIPIETITDSAENTDSNWLGKEPEIPESNIIADFQTEILVVGCGTAGMFAIAAAAEGGAKVIGIDRFPTGVGIRNDLGALGIHRTKEAPTRA